MSFYYVRGVIGWDSVVEITREIYGGWALRLVHGNIASFVFLVLFIHFFRGIFQASFYLIFPWIRGWVIMLLTMISAFLGYVLPWGQMSFWGATVIINLISILPFGKILVIWLWGGFYVSSFTCRFFFALHFVTPLVVLGLAGIHLILLHFRGRSVPGGLIRSGFLKVKFSHLFSYKDVVNIILLWCLWVVTISFPDWSADPVNFVVSDLSNSPLHIQPEWYFLHLYAILRSIPNKVGGLVGFALAIVLLLFLSVVFSPQSVSQIGMYNFLAWFFLCTNLILLWLGIQAVEEPFIIMGQASTVFYFSYIFIVLIIDQRFCLIFKFKFSVRAHLISN